MHMSAQVVQDSVNKYRHGVLIGNFAEEEFGKDSVNRVRVGIFREEKHQLQGCLR